MSISEETLMAFADDELSAEEAQRVAAALDADPALVLKLDRMRRAKAALEGAFGGQLDLETPARLLAPFANPPRASASILAFPQGARRPLYALAAAACAALVFLVGRASVGDGAVMFARADGVIVAWGDLDKALDAQAAGANAGARIQIAMSIPDEGGGYCRVFRLEASTGLACGEAGEWRIDALAASNGATDASGYATAAGALPAIIQDAANQRRAGDPLDADAERRAMREGWR
ncbi:MAG: hypothetical protein ABL883_15425 [Terricaulis sp.]